MREIKFRGKSKSNKWIFGDLLRNEKGSFAIVPPFKLNSRNECSDYEVSEETIGQFTGLKDIIGKDIYDGDIVRWPRDNRLYLIKFQYGGFYASVEEFNKGIYGGFPLYALTECEEDELVCSVVGNIFDNKNLLEE